MAAASPSFSDLWSACKGRHPALLDGVHTLLRIARGEDLFQLRAQPWRRFQNRYLHEYLFLRRQLGGRIAAPVTPVDLLVTFLPTRLDYQGFLAPVTQQLHNRGLRCAVLAPGHSRHQIEPSRFPAEVVPLAAVAGPVVWWEARRLYRELAPHVRVLGDYLGFTVEQHTNAEVAYRLFAWDAALFEEVLRQFRPRLLFGIHFISQPGYLHALRHHGGRLKTVLIQHGAFSSSWEAHDYTGADAVILWGNLFRNELLRFKVQPCPTPVVLGNPKLELDVVEAEQVRASGRIRGQQRHILYVSTNGDNRKDTLALELFARAVQGAQDWRVAYKPHPAEDMGKFHALLRSGLIHEVQLLPATADMRQLIRESEVVVGTQSTVLPEALAFGKPVVQLLPELFGMGWEAWGLPTASSETGLKEMLDRLLHQPEERARLVAQAQPLVNAMFSEPRGAIQRIADYFEEELAFRTTPGSSLAASAGLYLGS